VVLRDLDTADGEETGCFVSDGTGWIWVSIKWMNAGELVAVDGKGGEHLE
jgi:hypothetical protein